MTYTVSHFVNGEVYHGTPIEQGKIYNPSTGEHQGNVLFASPEDINHTVQIAKQAQIAWANTPALRRARIFFNYKNLLEKNKKNLAQLVSQEHGKTLSDAEGSVIRGIEVVEFVCGAPHLLQGDYSENVGPNIDCYNTRQPLGVCVGITPFNFPAMVPMWMFPMALVCGNSFILKPSEKDPSCPLKLVELLHEAGLPNGLCNVIQGDKTAVDALITHPDVKAVSSVGSTMVAKHIYTTATQHGKRVQALGGAKNHAIVMPDADLDSTADALVGAAFGSAGERCMAISVVVAVGENTADNLLKKIKPQTDNLQIGPSDQEGVEMGPLVTQTHLNSVKNYVDLGVKEGADLLTDGRDFSEKNNPNGYYMGPCLFDNVKPNMKIYQEEIFGPVLSIVRVKEFSEAVELVNNHIYANGTAIFTRDGEAARRYANEIEVGLVGINVPIPVPMAFFSFGGWKQSLFGDMHTHGMEGIRFYTRMKTITSRWPKGLSQDSHFVIPTLG